MDVDYSEPLIVDEDEKLRMNQAEGGRSRRPSLYRREVQEDDYLVPKSGYYFEVGWSLPIKAAPRFPALSFLPSADCLRMHFLVLSFFCMLI